jgi:type VI secretion system secreted protein VgrG
MKPKRILLTTLTAGLALSVIACGSSDTNSQTTSSQVTNTQAVENSNEMIEETSSITNTADYTSSEGYVDNSLDENIDNASDEDSQAADFTIIEDENGNEEVTISANESDIKTNDDGESYVTVGDVDVKVKVEDNKIIVDDEEVKESVKTAYKEIANNSDTTNKSNTSEKVSSSDTTEKNNSSNDESKKTTVTVALKKNDDGNVVAVTPIVTVAPSISISPVAQTKPNDGNTVTVTSIATVAPSVSISPNTQTKPDDKIVATVTTIATNTPTTKVTVAETSKPTATSTPKPINTVTSTPKPTTTNTPKPTATNTPNPTATPTKKATKTVKSFIVMKDVTVGTWVSNDYGVTVKNDYSLINYYFLTDTAPNYPYITSHTKYTVSNIENNIKYWINQNYTREDALESMFINASATEYNSSYLWVNNYIIGQEETEIKIDNTQYTKGISYNGDLDCEDRGYPMYVYYDNLGNCLLGSVGDTIGCIYSDGTKEYWGTLPKTNDGSVKFLTKLNS